MNNTKKTRSLAIVAVLTAATLVVGLTVAATTLSTAFAGGREGNANGNTITAQINKQKAYQSGFDNTQEQEAENVICTHPGNSTSCVSESG